MDLPSPTGDAASSWGPVDAQPGVLMVTGAYFPDISGAGLQCRSLVRALRGKVRVSVLTTTTDRRALMDDSVDAVPVFRVFVDPASIRSKAQAAYRMARIVLRERRRCAILHLHGFSQKTMLLVALGLVTRVRLAIKLTSVGHDDPASIRARGRLAFWFYSRAHVFFGVSPRFQVLYNESGLPPEKFRLIPNGVDLTRFRPASQDERTALRDELNLPRDVQVVLFVGFFSREKCPDVLFEAWALAAAREAGRSVLVFVGATRSSYYEIDPDLVRDIRHKAAVAGLTDRIRFVEETREIERYHQAADVFVLPSVREGLPNALLEAMACGTACISSRLDGVTDTLIADGESGMLVPPRDVAALGTALTRLLSNPDRAAAMGRVARDLIVRDYAMADTANAYAAVYRELVQS